MKLVSQTGLVTERAALLEKRSGCVHYHPKESRVRDALQLGGREIYPCYRYSSTGEIAFLR